MSTLKPNLLIVDDDALVARALRRALKADFSVTVCISADEAESAVESTRFDCVLCDIHMPDVDGDVLVERLSQTAPPLKERVVFMSGGMTLDERARIERSGHPVVAKPFDLEEVKRTLISTLGTAVPAA